MSNSIHQQLKLHYVADTSRHEVDLDNYRIDAIDEAGRLIEVQCASLLAIRDKIRTLVRTHQVVVVKPLAARKRLLTKERKNGKVVRSRFSPTRQTLPWIFQELVHFTKAFPHPNLQLDVVLTEQEETRLPPKVATWRRRYSIQDRSLVSIQTTYSLRSPADLWSCLDLDLPEVFTTADLASSGQMPRWLAQKAAYCFREMNHIRVCGKSGNSIEYCLLEKKSLKRRRKVA